MSSFFSFAKISFQTVALAGLLAAAPALYVQHQKTAADLVNTITERQKAETTLAQLRSDGDAARQIRGRINVEEARRLLAPVERLTVAAGIERAASSFHMKHFTYTMAPEKTAKIDDADGTQNLALSSISLGAEAPSDAGIYQFITQLGHVLPGRLRVTDMEIERIGDANAALTSSNVRFKATLEWLSNGAVKNVAAAP
jgi:hypothetical protein